MPPIVMVGTHGHTSSSDRERPCNREWSNERPQGISKDASAGRGVPAPTTKGRTEPRRCLTSKPKKRRCCNLVFLLLDYSRPSVQPKLTCERHSVPMDVWVPVQISIWEETVVRFFFFFEIFLHTCARSLFLVTLRTLGPLHLIFSAILVLALRTARNTAQFSWIWSC